MSKDIILGIDPDAKASGLALYKNEKLSVVCIATLFQIYDWLSDSCSESVLVVMGDVTNGDDRKSQVGWHILEMCEHLGFEVVKRPVVTQWRTKRELFERRTGWDRSSVAVERSAAHIGYLEVHKKKYEGGGVMGKLKFIVESLESKK